MDYALIDDWQEIVVPNPVSHYLIVDLHRNGCGPTGSPGSLRFPTQPRTTFGRRELLFPPHSEQDLINQVIASEMIAALITELGLAPVGLGRLDQGGVPLHAVAGRPGGLLFQNLAKLL